MTERRSPGQSDGAVADEDAAIRFGVLGPVAVWRGSVELPIGSAQHRRLLAILLLHHNERISRARIVERLWPGGPPKSADNLVQKYVGFLRKAFDPGGVLLISVPGGYQLLVEPTALDTEVFAHHLDRARLAGARSELPEAAAELRTALDLWRGRPFDDLDVESAAVERTRLSEQRIAATEDLAEVRLASGDHVAVAADLARLVALHPLRERARALHMLALYRQGRQAEALGVYTQVRDLLADELGIDPDQSLQRLYERILRADPTLASQETTVRDYPGGPTPVCQLPSDLADFTGRTDHLDSLTAALCGGADRPPPVVVIVGCPGVGKSSLAVRAAHAVSKSFPDGQLCLDLAGTSPEPRDPADVLAEILRALGVTGAGVPASLHERAALYRSLVSGRRLLVMLDDAAGASQVRPLVPATSGCAVLVTSRQVLADLPNARIVDLDVFTPDEARELFARVVGAGRAAQEAAQTAAILRSCGHLPLAIRIAGARLASRPAWSLRVLGERLGARRLDELQIGELGVRASFDLSMRLLPAAAARALCLLALQGPRTWPSWVVAPLLDRPVADDVLDLLVDSSLVRLMGTDQIGQPRYRLHDLLQAYAVDEARAIPYPERAQAVGRMLAAWLDLLGRATDRLPPSLFRPAPGSSPRLPLPGELTDRLLAQPRRWLDSEQDSLLNAVRLAAHWRQDETAWELAATAVPYYDDHCRYDDWNHGHRLALRAVRTAGNRHGEAVLNRNMGQLNVYRDNYDQAIEDFTRSWRLCQEIGDKRGEALAIAGLGTVARVLGHRDEAFDHARRALDMAVAEGAGHLEAQLRNSIATLHLALGREAEAQQWFDDALALAGKLGDTHREAVVLRRMSSLHERRGDLHAALECLRRALRTFTALDDERCSGYTLLELGRMFVAQRDSARATPALTRAAIMFGRNGNRGDEAQCWQLLGQLDAENDQNSSARANLMRAQSLWRAVGDTARVATATEILHGISG